MKIYINKTKMLGALSSVAFLISGSVALADAGFCGAGPYNRGGDPNLICMYSTYGDGAGTSTNTGWAGRTYSQGRIDQIVAQLSAQIASASSAPQPLSPVATSTVSSMISASQQSMEKQIDDLHMKVANTVSDSVNSLLGLQDSNIATENQRKLELMIRTIVREEIQKSLIGSGN